VTEAAAQPLSRVLGDFAAGLRFDDLPRSVVDQAKMLIVDARRYRVCIYDVFVRHKCGCRDAIDGWR
jgi:hypothetical protein